MNTPEVGILGVSKAATKPVWNGSAGRVGVTTPRDVNISAPRFGGGPLQAKILYVGPVRAPIAKGQRIAELIIAATGMPTAHIPLVAAEAVGVAGPLDRVANGVRRLQRGLIQLRRRSMALQTVVSPRMRGPNSVSSLIAMAAHAVRSHPRGVRNLRRSAGESSRTSRGCRQTSKQIFPKDF